MDDLFLVGVMTCVFLVVVPLVLMANDNIDIDDTLGPYMCEQHNMTFLSAEENCMGFGADCSDKKLLIKCVPRESETQVDDGYLLLVGGG